MKRLFNYALVLALTTAPAFAAKNSESVNLPQAVTVGSTQLPAGDYKVSWTGTAPDVQVTFAERGKTGPGVTVAAKLIDEKQAHTGLTISRQGNANILEALDMGKVGIVLAGAPSAGQ